jgi:hypothetical protein
MNHFVGDQGTRPVMHVNIIKKKFSTSLAKLIDNFFDHEYTEKKVIFIAPYDYRMAPMFIDDFWEPFKA